MNRNEFPAIIQKAILDGVKLTATNIQKTYLPELSKQCVHTHIKSFIKRHPEYAPLFMTTREKAYVMIEEGKTVKQISAALGIRARQTYSYMSELKSGVTGK